MTRLAFLPWCAAIERILSSPLPNADGYDNGFTIHDANNMFKAGLSPVEAAAAIAIGLFEEEINR